jgi:hypothetical protein
MDMRNVLLIFFIVVVFLTVLSLIPSENGTGHFIMPLMISLEVAILIIIISLFTIAVILSKKSYYPF